MSGGSGAVAVDPQLWWWVARSSGLVAWAIVTVSIVLGLSLSSRLVRRRGAPAWLLDLHRYLGVLTIVFTGVHLVSLVADNYTHFGWSELFVPLASRWRPGAVAWGIAALYLVLAVQLTSYAMRRLPRRLWHAVHLGSFPLFVAATVHGALSGADRANVLVQWVALSGVLLVLFVIVFRLLAPRSSQRAEEAAARARAVPAGGR